MVNIAIIGCGQWGYNLTRSFFQNTQCKVRFCCDADKKKLKNIAEHFPTVKLCRNYKELLHSKDIDAVCIATPASTHYEIAKEFINKRKHIFVEKPLAISSNQAEELVDLSEKKKIIFMVGHVFEFNPGICWLKEHIEKGDLGKIYYLHSTRTNLGPIRNDVNVVYDLASHDISIFNYILNDLPYSVNASGAELLRKGLEDVAFITLYYRPNILANIHVSWLDPAKVRQITVIGDKKMAVFDDISILGKIIIFDKGAEFNKIYENYGEFQLLIRDGDMLIPKIPLYEPLRQECLNFIESIEKNRKPISDGYDGLNVVRVLEAVQKSIRNKGKLIEIANG